MSADRNVLFVCPTFPPHVGGALARNLQFLRHLPELGWRPTVLTVRGGSGPFQDETPLADLPPEVRIVRAWSPRYPSMSVAAGTAETARRSAFARTSAWLRRTARDLVVGHLLIPDREAPWIPFAVRAARGLLRSRDFAAVISLGPPHSAHLVARAVHGRRRWIADLTDPWAEHPFRRPGLRMLVDSSLERLALGDADVVVTPSPVLSERFRARLAGTRAAVATISNGYDEAEFAGVAPERVAGRHHVVHVGSFYGARSPGPVLEALRLLLSRRPALAERLLVSFYGYADPDARALVARASAQLGSALESEPFVPRARAVRVMLGADLLLLVTDATAAGRELIPLKTYEYLRAGRPILALAPQGALTAVLDHVGGARCVAPEDVPGIADALERSVDPRAWPPPDPERVAEFEGARLTARLAELLGG